VATLEGIGSVTGSGEPPPLWRSWSVWIIAAAFYLAAFYVRVSPAVMTHELMRDFHISARDLGNFSAFYFYAYVLMQIPTGVLVDSWGARKLLIVGAICAGSGTFLFASSSSFVVACAGRALVGASTAVGWVVMLKLATHWFPARRFATLSGLGLLVGNIGALFAQVPLRLLVESFGWRTVALASALFMLSTGALAMAVVRNDPSALGFATYAPAALQQRRPETLLQLLKGFRKIFAYRNTWLIFCAQGGFVGAMLSFTGLWGAPFLKARYAVPSATAAAICSVMIVCWASSSLLCGYLSDRFGRRKPIYVSGAAAAALGWAILFYAPGIPLWLFIGLAAITSFAAGAVILGFAFAKESVPVQFLGTISGAINAGNMIGPMLLQPAIGWVLDRQWEGQLAAGTRVFGLHAFHAAFGLILAWAVVSFLLASATRDTACHQLAME
jgi:sugar phosphate permease